MALTKAEMAERLFDEVGLNKREAKEFVDAFFDTPVSYTHLDVYKRQTSVG